MVNAKECDIIVTWTHEISFKDWQIYFLLNVVRKKEKKTRITNDSVPALQCADQNPVCAKHFPSNTLPGLIMGFPMFPTIVLFKSSGIKGLQ